MNVEFSYNRTFNGNNAYPSGGSWTRNLRPDYTLSIWPFGIEADQAEKEELIVHIHFDAKYKIENLTTLFNIDEALSSEKEEQNKGTYKRANLLKMHTYRDAIRRTGGAYILYPGTESSRKIGFHELLPGLGAFAIKPSSTNSGTTEIKKFLKDIIKHFLNRASQRERMSFKTYETYKAASINEIREALPESYGKNRSLIPDETFILVGYYRDDKYLQWFRNKKIYNARTGTDNGSLRLGANEVAAKYLLLHLKGETTAGTIFKLTGTGPRVFSKQKLIQMEYPTEPSQEFYLVYDIELEVEKELQNIRWDITKLTNYSFGHGSAKPFSTSLSELMRYKM